MTAKNNKPNKAKAGRMEPTLDIPIRKGMKIYIKKH